MDRTKKPPEMSMYLSILKRGRISPSGTYTSLYSFGSTPTDGIGPSAALVQGSDGNFYGTTYSGGDYSGGIVFQISPSGGYISVYSFDGHPGDGATPVAGLVQGSDGKFYGTTEEGGTNACQCGTVFQISSNGVYMTLYSFDGHPGDGATPVAGLVQGSDGSFNGTTEKGGTNNDGTVFRFTPSVCGSPVANFGPFRITGLAIQGSNVLTTWLAPEGSTNVVQATNGGGSGNYSNNFVNIGPTNWALGFGLTQASYTDVGGATNKPSRYYRIQLVPDP